MNQKVWDGISEDQKLIESVSAVGGQYIGAVGN